MKKMLPLILAITCTSIFISKANACYNDYDCGYGNACVKPSDTVGVEGTCVTPTDEYGTPQTTENPPSSEPHEVSGCQFDTDCDIGFSCVKKSGDLYGLCIK